MIEEVSKTTESQEKAKETKSCYDPDKKVEKNTINADKTQWTKRINTWTKR